MKKFQKVIILLAFACLLPLGMCLPVCAAEQSAATVTAVGFAETELPARRFALQVELSDYGRSIEHATEANDARLARLREQLAPFAALTECAFYTQESFSGSRLCVTRCLRLEGDISALTPDLYAHLHACGVTAVCEPELFASPDEREAAQSQALQAALADALSHAAALGGSDSVLEIEKQCGFCNGFARFGEGGAPTVRIGASVRVTVKKG